jgi:hypothetical protein
LGQVDAALGASVAQREGRGYSKNIIHLYGGGRTPISLYHLLLEGRNMDEHQCSVLFFECSPPRQTNSVLSLKLSFKKAVPQIKYDHTFKSTDFNWRRWTSNDYFTGKLVVLVVLVVLGFSMLFAFPFAPQGFMKGATRKEREDEKEK